MGLVLVDATTEGCSARRAGEAEGSSSAIRGTPEDDGTRMSIDSCGAGSATEATLNALGTGGTLKLSTTTGAWLATATGERFQRFKFARGKA